jgi:two-component system, OmpR family, alkaline phosphatase synthesis response regulator PhoP
MSLAALQLPQTMRSSRILIVEDNHNLALGLRNNFEIEGYEVDVAHDGVAGLEMAREHAPDLIILDLMLPRMEGYRVLRTLRDEGREMPVLILTARGEEAEKVRGLGLGADDYVTKPFGLMELLARVKAHLRRAREDVKTRVVPLPTVVKFGEIEVTPATHDVTLRGAPVALRPKEFDLLLALIRRQGGVVTRIELLREVWGYDETVVSRTVDTHVAELRRKLEEDPTNPRYVLTVRKTGYRLGVPLEV